MQRRIAELKQTHFDVLVIGAGITGAWIALDCVSRGLSVAIVDKQDFGAGTSAKSSKLIHGGIRYLQQLRFGKVRESARERAYYHRAAPHLTHFLPFMVPTYSTWSKGRAVMQSGMALYRLLCAGENEITQDPQKKVPPPFYLNRAETLRRLPLIDPDLRGAMVYYESHMEDSERMTLAVLDKADQMGAFCINYVRVDGVVYADSDTVAGVEATDMESDERFSIHARLTVNATGPWLSTLNRTLFEDVPVVNSGGQSRGSHLVTRQLVKDYAVALPTRYAGQNIIDRGGRHIFILPWRGCSLIGTSYVAATDVDDPVTSAEEVDQLIGEINRQLPDFALGSRDILHTFAGIYPLQEDVVVEKIYQGTGDYQIVDHAPFGYQGVISALGAKFTTARLVAEKVADLGLTKLGKVKTACRTRGMRLSGAEYTDLNQFVADRTERFHAHLNPAQVDRLIGQYGANVDKLFDAIERDPGLTRPLCDDRPNLEVEVHHAVKSEMAVRLEDVIYRRTGIGTIGFPGQACIDRCVGIMADLLAWDAARCTREIDRLQRYKANLGPG